MDSPTLRASTPLGRASSSSMTSYGSVLAPPRTSVLLAKGVGRPGTGPGSSPISARPIISSKAAGYISLARSGTGSAHATSPTKSGVSGGTPTRSQCEALEDRVHVLLEAAAERAAAGDGPGAVDAAKEAARREQRLCIMLEAAGASDQISLDLKYAVSVALGAAYEANGQLTDALGVYSQVIKSRLFPHVRWCCCLGWQGVSCRRLCAALGCGFQHRQPEALPPAQHVLSSPTSLQAGWLRLNMGAIHFSQQDYAAAAKQWRMALDLTPPSYRRMRLNTQVGCIWVLHACPVARSTSPCLHCCIPYTKQPKICAA